MWNADDNDSKFMVDSCDQLLRQLIFSIFIQKKF